MQKSYFRGMNNKVTTPIDEVQAEKLLLQREVGKLANDFANKTGALVSNIELTYERNSLTGWQKLLKVDISINIPNPV